MVRKLIIILLSALLCQMLSAQDHLDFQGIPVDGPLPSLVKPLKGLGFKAKDKDRDCHWFRGKYYGEQAELMVATTSVSGTAYLFMLTCPAKSDWPSLKNQYDYFKMRLTALHGEPTNLREDFTFPYTESDGLRALEYDKCHFVCTWVLPEGKITLTITTDHHARLFFIDRTNSDLATSEGDGQ